MRRIVLIALVATCLLTGCGGITDKETRTDFALDTVVSVTVYGETAKTTKAALDASFAEVERLESLLSATCKSSDIWRVNNGNGVPVTVATETIELLTLSQRIAALSHGAFDVTIRPVSALWDFSADSPAVPPQDRLSAACKLVDYQKLTVSDTTVTLPAGGLEPGGIAKGFIADKLRDLLKQQGVVSALIDLGGNIVAVGDKEGQPFRIGVKNPLDVSSLCAIVNVRDDAVVTSGVYERGFTLDGVRYHHLLDPHTGMPVQNGLASVTILAANSAVADGLSTACFVLGETEGKALLKQFPDAQGIFVYADGSMTVSDGLTLQTDTTPPVIQRKA